MQSATLAGNRLYVAPRTRAALSSSALGIQIGGEAPQPVRNFDPTFCRPVEIAQRERQAGEACCRERTALLEPGLREPPAFAHHQREQRLTVERLIGECQNIMIEAIGLEG